MEIVHGDVTSFVEVQGVGRDDGIVLDPEDSGHVLSIDGQAGEDDREEAEAIFEMCSSGSFLTVEPTISCPVKRIDSCDCCLLVAHLQ